MASTSTISDEDLQSLEQFVVLLYDRKSNCNIVNEYRRDLFTKKGRTVENIPSTLDALHIKRASLQSKGVSFVYIKFFIKSLSLATTKMVLTKIVIPLSPFHNNFSSYTRKS